MKSMKNRVEEYEKVKKEYSQTTTNAEEKKNTYISW